MQVMPVLAVALNLNLALRRITINLTRDGEQASNEKVTLMMHPAALTVAAVFVARDGVAVSQLFLASAVDRDWLLIATDTIAPKRSASRYPVISEDVTFALDLSDGAAPPGGSPALLSARVLVDGEATQREVLAVEQQTDGDWRIAGHARTELNGEVTLDLRVTGVGRVYALGLDDWGIQFQPSLAVTVGQNIRPSVFTGWLYRITEDGTLPATEPAWWPAEGDNASRLLGTARAVAVRYYQPLAHGPLPVELL